MIEWCSLRGVCMKCGGVNARNVHLKIHFSVVQCECKCAHKGFIHWCHNWELGVVHILEGMMTPVFAQCVSRILGSSWKLKINKLGGNGFLNPVKGKEISVAFVKSIFNYQWSKNLPQFCCQPTVALFIDTNSKASWGIVEVNALFNAIPSCKKFRSVGCSFNCGLLLWVLVNGSTIDKVETWSDRFTSESIMEKVGNKTMG